MDISALRAGTSSQFTTFDLATRNKTVRVPPGETVTLFEGDGPAVIERIWMTFNGWFYEHWNPDAPVDPAILKLLILRIYWDGSDVPSVEAPLGDFFGCGHREYAHYASKYLGMTSGGFYCAFPMPYLRVRATLTNLHDVVNPHVFVNASVTHLDALPPSAGRFHCQFRTGRRQGSEPAQILDVRGRGHFAGCSVSMQGERLNYLSYLEAPEHFFVDGDESPTIVGTGLEDYFGGGWYFREGPFAAPLHGVPLKDPLRSMITMYRFHEGDAVLFQRSLSMSFRTPWAPEHVQPYWYASTAYHYLDAPCRDVPAFPAREELLSQYRARDTDHLSMP